MPTLDAVRRAVTAIRDSKLPDPKVLGNAGSFFTNPVIPTAQYEALKALHPDIPSYVIDEQHVKVPAGWLIEHVGWKGRLVLLPCTTVRPWCSSIEVVLRAVR